MLKKRMAMKLLVAMGVLLTIPMARGAEPAAPTVVPGRTLLSPVSGRPTVPLAGEWKRQYVIDPGAVPGDKWEAKPFQLPQGNPLPGTKEPAKPENYPWGVWYERTIDIPADWAGRRTVVHIGRCLYGVAVYANGTKAGEIPGYGGDVDISALAPAGKPATLRLYCGRLGKGLETKDVIEQCAATYFQSRDPGGSWLCADTGIIGMPETFRLESQGAEVHVQDVWYQTTVRGGAMINPVVTVASATARDGLSCRVRIYAPGSDKPVLEKSLPLGRLPAGESTHRLVLLAPALKVWGLLDPNLYFGQAEIVDAAGSTLDRSNPVRFGIREVWAQGRQFMLNGRPICPVIGHGGSPQNLDAYMATGVNMIQNIYPLFFTFRWVDSEAVAAACDERGVLLMAPGMSSQELNLGDADVLQGYEAWGRGYYRLTQNNPSLVLYGLGVNCLGTFNDFAPNKLGRSSNLDTSQTAGTRSYLISKKIDPTRLYYFHGGPRGGDVTSGNIYPNHTPVQEVEDWGLEWSEKGDLPFMTSEGLLGQFSVDYLKGNKVYVTEYAARLLGDQAYVVEPDSYRSYVNFEWFRVPNFWDVRVTDHPLICGLMANDMLRGGRAWRYLGLSLNNWNGLIGAPEGGPIKNPLYLQAAKDLRNPVLAWIGGPLKDFTLKDHDFYAGETVEKTLLGIHDRKDTFIWNVRWEVKVRATGTVVASGDLTHRAAPFSRVRTPFSFTLPEVAVPTDLDLTLTVKDKGAPTPIAQDAFRMTVFPRRVPASAAAAPALFAFDPEGETSAWLKRLGATLEPWKPGSRVEGRTLVIGRRGLKGLKAIPYTAEDIQKGLRVVIFEQHCADLDKIGLRHEDRSPRQLFLRQKDHPLLAGLTDEALRDWRGHATLISEGPEGDRIASASRSYRAGNRGSVASDVIEIPHFGPYQSLIDGEFDLSYSALMTWRHGLGEVIFCQLDLVDRIGIEPAADILAGNLLAYLRTPLPPRTEKTAICLDEATAKLIDGLGFAATVAGRLAADKTVLVATGAQTAAIAAKRSEITSFLNDGGEMLVLYATAETLADPLFAGRLTAEKTRVDKGVIPTKPDPLLRGVGPQNLHWRSPVDLLKLGSNAPAFIPLLDGLAGILPIGSGRIVFFQADPKGMADLTAVKEMEKALTAQLKPVPKPIDDGQLKGNRIRTAWQVNRLRSLILGNLGLRGSDSLTSRLFELKSTIPFAPINEWIYMGPFAPLGNPDVDGSDPLERKDLAEFAMHRDLNFEGTSTLGDKVKWIVPTDSQNGLGDQGKMDLSKILGVRCGQAAIAVTHIWSTREREAVVNLGADYWIQVMLNGQKVFRSTDKGAGGFEHNFGIKITVKLKAGWNEVLIYNCSGSGSHIFWFQISNPGDVAVAQQLTVPADAPAKLPKVSDLLPDSIPEGYSPYTEPFPNWMDPYSFMPW